MQIRLSQQSLSPLHHFLHSNAFSLLYKIPPLQPDAVAGLVLSELPSQFTHVFPRRRRTCMAETVFYTFYCQESVETIKKMDALGDFFFFSLSLPIRWITLPLGFQQEAVRLSEGAVGWIAKVNVFFFFFKLLLLDKSISALHLHSSLCVTGERLLPRPSPHPQISHLCCCCCRLPGTLLALIFGQLLKFLGLPV